MVRPTPDGYLIANAVLWAHEFFDVFDLPFDVEIEWNHRYRKTIAMAELDSAESFARISLASRIYPVLLPSRRVEVIAHECCHVAAWHLHGEVADHGVEWRDLMRRVGFREAGGYMVVDRGSMKGGLRWPTRGARRSG